MQGHSSHTGGHSGLHFLQLKINKTAMYRTKTKIDRANQNRRSFGSSTGNQKTFRHSSQVPYIYNNTTHCL